MASVDTSPQIDMPIAKEERVAAQVLVCLGPNFAEPGSSTGYQAIVPLLEALNASFRKGGDSAVLLAHPVFPGTPEEKLRNDLARSVTYTPPADVRTSWLQTAADFRIARDLMTEYQCKCCLMLGADAAEMSVDTLIAMAEAVCRGDADLAIPCYTTEMDEALLNSALIYPVTRAIYGSDVRMPLAMDLAMSARMCERMGLTAQRVPAAAQASTLLWPVAEACSAGYPLAEVATDKRPMHVTGVDLKEVLATIAGSLFSDVEGKAQFWQRTRPTPPVQRIGVNSGIIDSGEQLPHSEAASMIENFRLAYASLHEIWAMVLPPNSLLGLKKLSLMPVESFRMSDALWVRVVYDFLLAHRLRTLNRGHLLGALTPLYLAWVATYVLQCNTAAEAKRQVESLAMAFEADKPYLVSRWRWPDRFNP